MRSKTPSARSGSSLTRRLPGYTKGLVGTPNELKLKYLADNDFGDLKGEALKEAIEERIREKTSESLVATWCPRARRPAA